MAPTARETLLAYLGILAVVLVGIMLRAGMQPAAPPPHIVEHRLQQELGARVGAIARWEHERREVVEGIADEASLRQRLTTALAGSAAPLDALLGSLCAELVGCAVARPDGSVVASFAGRHAPRGLVERAARGRTVHSTLLATDALGRPDPAPRDARYALFFATPIVEDGEVRAVLTARVSPDAELGPILGERPPGRTGETYAVDPRGYMVTRSRFDSQGSHPANAPRVLGGPATWLRTPSGAPTRPLASLQRSGIDVDGYRDYRGVRVVGAWRWLDELGAGVITEMDAAEAFRTK